MSRYNLSHSGLSGNFQNVKIEIQEGLTNVLCWAASIYYLKYNRFPYWINYKRNRGKSQIHKSNSCCVLFKEVVSYIRVRRTHLRNRAPSILSFQIQELSTNSYQIRIWYCQHISLWDWSRDSWFFSEETRQSFLNCSNSKFPNPIWISRFQHCKSFFWNLIGSLKHYEHISKIVEHFAVCTQVFNDSDLNFKLF